MLINRFIRILKSRLPKTKSDTKDFEDESNTFKESENQKSDSMHPSLKKEAEYYANLEIKPGSGFTEIKGAYKELIRKYHPDKHAYSEEKRKIAEEITRKLNEAYNYFEKKFNGKA